MSNFPGNPFATDHRDLTSDGAAISSSIALLAYEVRTLNLILNSRPVVLDGDIPPEVLDYVDQVGSKVIARLGNPGEV